MKKEQAEEVVKLLNEIDRTEHNLEQIEKLFDDDYMLFVRRFTGKFENRSYADTPIDSDVIVINAISEKYKQRLAYLLNQLDEI